MDGYRSLQQIVESRLRRDVIEGFFGPGERLRERELSERYGGVSRGPIREALRALEAQGLVEHMANKGFSVAELSVAEMSEIYEMRVELEGLAARTAAIAATDEGCSRVAPIYERLRATDVADPAWLSVNNEFHSAIYSLGSRPRLLGLIQQLMESVEPYMRLYLEVPEHLSQSADEHEELWQALLQRDPGRCESLTRKHLSVAGVIMEKMLKRLASKSGTTAGD